MKSLLAGLLKKSSALFRLLKNWSGDDAYELYLKNPHHKSCRPLSQKEFYKDYFEARGKKPRCC